ncbi:peptide-methionine (S)-S-oxide reductase MsrA [soil metagenome]
MKRLVYLLVALLPGSVFTACGQNSAAVDSTTAANSKKSQPMPDNAVLDTATFGAGCFWCVEAQFQMLEGVVSVTSGFSGGTVKNPAYREVCDGTTGHAEVCQIVYDTTKISYDEMLEAFWHTHDPTQLNRQGNDVGTQYRSVIFYHNEEQKKKAEFYKQQMNEKNTWGKPVVTEISPAAPFYKAEDYHQNYYNQNGNEGYCQYVVRPKVEKFREVFKDKLKK